MVSTNIRSCDIVLLCFLCLSRRPVRKICVHDKVGAEFRPYFARRMKLCCGTVTMLKELHSRRSDTVRLVDMIHCNDRDSLVPSQKGRSVLYRQNGLIRPKIAFRSVTLSLPHPSQKWALFK